MSLPWHVHFVQNVAFYRIVLERRLPFTGNRGIQLLPNDFNWDTALTLIRFPRLIRQLHIEIILKSIEHFEIINRNQCNEWLAMTREHNSKPVARECSIVLDRILKFAGIQNQEDRDTKLYNDLIRHEAKIGGTIFGPVPKGHRREFFCLDHCGIDG